MLELPDGSFLVHNESGELEHVYDPVKAREYYLRTRKLKGRKKGLGEVPSPGSGRQRQTVGSGSVTVTIDGMSYKLTPRQLAEQQAYAAMRVAKIKSKASKLQRALKVKLVEAKRKEREAKKPDSAAEKRKKAKDSEQYRDKHKQELRNKAKRDAAKKGKSGAKKHDLDSVAGIEKAITDTKIRLSEAVDRQRALANATRR